MTSSLDELNDPWDSHSAASMTRPLRVGKSVHKDQMLI
jgi:hypothetical protein